MSVTKLTMSLQFLYILQLGRDPHLEIAKEIKGEINVIFKKFNRKLRF